MQHDFWHNAWKKDNPGWRQNRVNTRLQRHWPELQLQRAQRVLVPLCGDSPDLLWLLQQGFEVIGVELSELAVKRFFSDNNLPCEVSQQGELLLYAGSGSGQGLQIYCGDFFKLDTAQLGTIAAVYDRAATVALPPDLRTAYASQLAALLQGGTPVLLISMAYDQQRMQGPPFSVPDAAVRALFSEDFAVDTLSSASGPDILGGLAERGLDSLEEIVYKLTRKTD